jgi:hypothetical protein
MYFHFDKFTIPTVYGIYRINGSRKELANLTRLNAFPPVRFSPAELGESSRFLSRMREITEDREALHRIRNQYETYIYRVKDCLEFDTNFQQVITADEHALIAEAVAAHRAWLSGSEAEQASLSTFQDRLDVLKNITARGPSGIGACEAAWGVCETQRDVGERPPRHIRGVAQDDALAQGVRVGQNHARIQ